jgi:hypothetical protein
MLCPVLLTSLPALAASAATPAEREPLLLLPLGDTVLSAPILIAGRYETTSDYVVDRDRQRFAAESADPLLRVGLRFDAKRAWVPFLVLAEYEHDLATGNSLRLPTLEGDGYPGQAGSTDALRKLYLRLSLGWYAHLGFGFNTSHWGLGLLANDGAHGFTPGSAAFHDPRGGDRVLRGFLASGPHTDLNLFAALAFDRVESDDALLEGDAARQLVGSLIVGRNLPTSAGVYLVRRWQDRAEGGQLAVNVIDATAETLLEIEDLGTLKLAAELAHIFGDTDFAATPDAPEHRVSQLGAVVRGTLDLGVAGAVLDLAYASGDGSFDDDVQRGFKADPNYALGLLMFRHYLAAQTARAPYSASDPELLGVPPRGLERVPTRGGLSNAWAIFPRGFWRPIAELEIYGGPLFAWSAAPVQDPLQTRLAGGVPHNAFDAAPGSYLGSEFDIGARYTRAFGPMELALGGEFGVLFPGEAFNGGRQKVTGGRVTAEVRL